MVIDLITLRVISAPLKQPFVTALGTLTERSAIIVEVTDQNGQSGWGEVVAFSSPWYTEETVTTCYYMLKEFLIPSLYRNVSHPNELQKIFSKIRGNHMAKSGLECAFWDLYSKQLNVPLYELVGGVRNEVESGVVIASDHIYKALSQIESFLEDEYKRYKVKIAPDTAIDYLTSIRKEYPTLPLMVDANSSFCLQDVELLKQLDEFELMMIEQPLSHEDLLEHGQLQKQLVTPICLDESITSFHDVQHAVTLNSCNIISVKMGRIGGWGQAVQIHDYCLQNDIALWCGGMIEFGISKAHNIALATLEGFTLPGDLSSSSRFWEEDIIEPEIDITKGKVKVPSSPGIGYEINFAVLDKLTSFKETFQINSIA